MSAKNTSKDAIKMLYKERKQFIIIGLTGRTGAGCSTVAKFLEMDFDQISAPTPKDQDFNSNEERKYKIVYRYAKENWQQFIKIKVRNIITSFIIQEDFDTFRSYLKRYEDEIIGYSGVISDLDLLKDKYSILHKKMLEVKSKIDRGEKDELSPDKVYNFYFNKLNQFTDELYDILKKYDIQSNSKANLYTFLYQVFGNNIRSSGSAYKDTFEPDKIFSLSYRINVIIKLLRKMSKDTKNGVMVVIDAFRNPYEVTFFKDRYAAFYLFSVNTNNKDRVKRLHQNNFSKEQIKALDDQEYPEKTGVEQFMSQNIQKCIEFADIHLYNPTEEGKGCDKLKKQLIKYISLIMHPGLITPTHEERCMQVAYISKLNSGCLSRQVGAVVTNNKYSIKAIGWNSVPEGQTPCNLRNLDSLISGDDRNAFSNYENKTNEYISYLKEKVGKKINNDNLNGRLFPYCFKDAYNSFKRKKNQVHTRSLHAEENAFLQVAKYGGSSLENGFLFTTASPCELCSKKAYQLGIKKIFYIDPYPGISNSHILKNGNKRPKMILFKGAIGKAYTKLYEQFISFKDELYMLTNINYKEKKYIKKLEELIDEGKIKIENKSGEELSYDNLIKLLNNFTEE